MTRIRLHPPPRPPWVRVLAVWFDRYECSVWGRPAVVAMRSPSRDPTDRAIDSPVPSCQMARLVVFTGPASCAIRLSTDPDMPSSGA